MQKSNQKFLWIYIARPYSWIGAISIALLANVISTGNLTLNSALLEDVLITLVSWISAILLLEYLHRDTDKRIRSLSPFIFILIILILILAYKNPYTLILLFLAIPVGILYASKTRSWFISGFSFMFRGIWEVYIFLTILFFHHYYNINSVFYIILIIYCLTISRNLVGDMRDVKYDKFTFPNRYGLKASYLISGVLILIPIFLIKNLVVSLPLIFYLFLLALIRDSYISHRIFTLTTAFFLINYVAYFLNAYLCLAFINTLFIATLLNFTYNLTPRRANEDRNNVHS